MALESGPLCGGDTDCFYASGYDDVLGLVHVAFVDAITDRGYSKSPTSLEILKQLGRILSDLTG